MQRFPHHVFLAGSLLTAIAMPAIASPTLDSAPLNSGWTAGAMRFAPAHLDRSGEADVSLRQSFDQYSTMQGPSTALSLQLRALPSVLLYADYGKLTQLGLRGPLSELGGVQLGWDAALRHDTYMLSQTGAQVLVPFTYLDAVGWGGDFRLNGKSALGGMNLYYGPLLSVMSNRWGVGLEAGVEYDLAGWVLGANAGARYHFGLKDAPAYSYVMQPFEDILGLGVRKALTDTLEANVAFQWQPDNAYGMWNRSYTAGVSWRMAQKAAEKPPAPKPVAVAPTPAPTPAPVATPAPMKAPLSQGLMLSGRVFSSLNTDGRLSGPVTVRLKHRAPGETGFVTIPKTLQADANGNFLFTNLAKGDYQVFFKDESGDPTLVDYALADATPPGPEGQVPQVDLDVAWSGIDALADDSAVQVNWQTKPGLSGAIYQGLVRGNLAGAPVDFTNFPAMPSEATQGRYELTAGMRQADSVNVVIKYWKPGNSFAGSGFYGQSKPILPKRAQ
ncbi:hypothetical protein D3C86_752550 [compost metagenome]